MSLSSGFVRIFLSLCLVLGVVACTNTGSLDAANKPSVVDVAPTVVKTATPSELIAKAGTVTPIEGAALLLQAATLLKDSGDLTGASAALQRIFPGSLSTPAQVADAALLNAEIALARNLPTEALNALQQPNFPLNALTPPQQIRYHQVRARAQEANKAFLVSALERIALDPLLTPSEQRDNHSLIWQALVTVPVAQLQNLSASATNNDVRGWYDLALVAQSYSYDLDRQLLELQRWRNIWATHPAATVLPPQMELLETLARESPRQIALLLPLGTNAGVVVRDAFMSAYFSLQEQGGQVPHIKLYDTSNLQDIRPLHQQARAEGAQLIIGPLTKDHVAQLHGELELGVPTLALNNIEGQNPSSPLLYQFALSPEDEARQVAEHAWAEGFRHTAIFAPADNAPTDVFTRKRDAFRKAWESLGGKVVTIDEYSDNYTDSISDLLRLSESKARAARLQSLLGRSLVAEQRRRQDIDFIYLLSQAAPARQIVPSFSYLYAGDLPIYATQEIFSGTASQTDDRDLNGVIFGESPWLLSATPELAQARRLFPAGNAQTRRLQAFGIDAFRLYPRLRLLESGPNIQIPGASGTLKLAAQHNIVRQLSWATINDGLLRAKR